MSRTIVSEKSLIEWLNSRLHQDEELINCRFTHVKRLAEKDELGCNWSGFVLQCGGIPAHVCGPTAQRIAVEAQKLFSLEENK